MRLAPSELAAKASGRKEYTSSYRRQTVGEQDFHCLATGKLSTAARLRAIEDAPEAIRRQPVHSKR